MSTLFSPRGWTERKHETATDGRRPRKPGLRNPRRAALRLEPLEERALLSTLTVTNSLDDGSAGTLRSKIAASAAGDTIVFAPGLAGSTITETTAQGGTLSIGHNLTITGLGANLLAVSGGGNNTVFTIAPGVTANVSGLKVTGGKGSSNGSLGGGFYNNGGTLTISNSSITGNTATIGSAIIDYPGGTLKVDNSAIYGNTGLYDTIRANGGAVTITNSTIANNTATKVGGAFPATGGLGMYGAQGGAATATLTNDTFSGNSGSSSNDLLAYAFSSSSAITLQNTILGSSVGHPTAPNAVTVNGGTITSLGHNLISDFSVAPASGDIDGTIPQLSPLTNNGGPTPTLALQSTSPALNAGNDVAAPLYDQRGAERGPAGVAAGTHTDIGAYEATSSYLVTSTTDVVAVGTLRGAVSWANGNTNPVAPGTTNTIHFDTAGTFATPQTITLPLLRLSLTSAVPVTIAGPGANLLSINGNNADTVFVVNGGETATLSGMTITGGFIGSGGGGVNNSGTLTVVNSRITGNTGFNGGAILTNGPLMVVNSSLDGNNGVYNGAIQANDSNVTIENSTIANNHTTGSNGGFGAAGGIGIAGSTKNVTATLVNDTFSGNTAVNSLTGLDIYDQGFTGHTATITLVNTILASSLTPGSVRPNAFTLAGGVITSLGHNVSSDASFTAAAGDQLNTNPLLGALTNNGGPTPTQALPFGSPAIDNGLDSAAISAGLTTDQRGPGFPRFQGAHVDVGAYESTALADLKVTKSGAPNPVSAGANLTYTVMVSNVGPGAAQTVTLSDPLPANTTLVAVTTPAGWTETDSVAVGSNGTLTFSKPTLASSASSTFTIVVKVAASVANNFLLSNTATAATTTAEPSPDPNPDFATATTTVNTRADLSVVKTGPATASAGGNLTYIILVTNNGPSDAQTVALTDTLPAGTTFVSQAQGGGPVFTLSNVGNAINDTIATLPAGASSFFAVTAHLLSSDPNGTSISNTATVGSATTDPNPGNNSSTATTTVQTSADLVLTVVSAPTIVNRGQILTYTVTLTNNGPSDAQHVLFNDSLPSATTFVSQTQTAGGAQFTLTNNGNSIGDSILTLPAGASQTFTIMTKVKTTATIGATLSNSAAVTSFTPDPNLANNSVQTTNTVGAGAPTGGVHAQSIQAANVATTSRFAGVKFRSATGHPHARPAQSLPAWWRRG